MKIKAVILAGGEGTRFKPYTDMIPKPMLPLGYLEKPVLEYIIEWINCKGLEEVVILGGYKWRQIFNYFRHGDRHNIHIKYSIDDDQYKGTGGALIKAYKNGLFDNAEALLVWYGDILAPVNITELIHFFKESKADAILTVSKKYKIPVGTIKINEQGYVTQVEEKPSLPIMITIGVFLIATDILANAEDRLGKRFDLMADFFPDILKQGRTIKAYVHKGWWVDLGSFERYIKIEPYKLNSMECTNPNRT